MSLDSSLSVATTSLANINFGFSVISQNIANANNAGYATENTTAESLDAGGIGFGVRNGPTQLASNAALAAVLYGQNAESGGTAVTNAALTQLQPMLGTVGQGNDLGSLLGNVQTAFSALLNDPSDQTQQAAVVSAAQSLTQGINAVSGAYAQTRQEAQDNLVSSVSQLNSLLGQVGSISSQIVSLKASGGDTADLENQRNGLLTSISGLADTRFAEQPNGDMLVFTAGGAQLPTHTPDPLSIAAATTGPTTFYPGGGLPGIMLGATDITSQITGGSIGANLTLRDSTIPTYQGELDEFSQNLAGRFDAQGLTLFSDGQGNVPASGGTPAQANYIGFASAITVNPAVVANPALVRDGTHAVAGSATGASAFTPNPNNLAGFTDMINRVLNFSLGSQVQAGVTQPASTTTGLGPAGNLAAPFSAPATLGDFATDITGSQSADAGDAASAASETAATQSAFSNQLTSSVGVDMDTQMSMMVQLQNAYGANAKIISAVQSMYSTLLQAIQ
ncbi:MAG TPA: flagellar basal body rod C-terminal domain-containing protein [Acetobacteraceae bacterium]|nr:flagellar basal body rod C-terminal domain-containing protein [Acetobacteraceae bacterium]